MNSLLIHNWKILLSGNGIMKISAIVDQQISEKMSGARL